MLIFVSMPHINFNFHSAIREQITAAHPMYVKPL